MALARLLFLASAVLLLLCNEVNAARRAAKDTGYWVDTWASMPQLTEPANLPSPPFNQTNSVFRNATIRQTIHTSIGADQIRLRISNVFGGSDLPITAVTVALPASGAAGSSSIDTNTLKPVTFSGSASITIPNGALVVSDPISFTVKPQSMLAVSIYTAQGQTTNSITSHPGSRTTSWFCIGNYVNSADMTGSSRQSAAHWYFLSAVEAWAPTSNSAFVIVGDSITDGRGSDDNANNRWPDLVLAKMQQNAATANIAVINQAAGGNRILADGLGPNALGRIDRDVLAQSGVKYAMIFEGVNDIGTADTSTQAQQDVGDRLIWAFQQIATRVHTFGIPIFAATITPFGGPGQAYSNPNREATRQRVNNFIRTSGIFDAVIDFDKILADPSNPSQLKQTYNSGDYLHPNVAGYQAIADAFPLDIFDLEVGSANPPVTSTVPVTSTLPPATSTQPTFPSTTSTIASTTTSGTTPISTGTVAHYGQCGGSGYTGATGCVSPYKCTKLNDYFSQCL